MKQIQQAQKGVHEVEHRDKTMMPHRVAPRLEGVVKNVGTKKKKKTKKA